MIKIKIVKKISYQGAAIYIRQFDTIFEYLIIKKGKLYSSYFEIKPQWFRRFLPDLYTPSQFEQSINLTVASAHRTIELLKEQGK